MSDAAARIAVTLAIAGFAVYAALASPYELRVLTLAGCQVLIVLGYQFIFGHAGALSLAQGAFFGLGAYATAILGTRYGLGFVATFPLSIALPVALAALVAIPVLRLASHYFALATLGLAQVVLLAFVNGGEWTGGALGIAGIAAPSLWGFLVPRGLPLVVLVWTLVALGALLAMRLTHGLTRSALAMLRGDPLGAGAIGIDAARLRFAAFLLSAGYAGAAGALQAHAVGVVSAETLGFTVMVTCLAMTVIGGSTRIAGAFLGALLLTYLPEKLRFLEGNALLAYGAALLAMVILAPEGLAGLLARAGARFWHHPPPHPVPLPAGERERSAATNTLLPWGRARQYGDATLTGEGTRKVGYNLLEARDLARRFGGIEAVTGVDLIVTTGEILGLIGPNGSGKTTLANLVTGLVTADRGAINFVGRRLDGLPAHEIAEFGIARTFQTPALPADMIALETVAVACASRAKALGFATALRGSDRGEHRRRLEAEAMAWLERLGVATIALRRCRDLPPGLARRAEIARALALEPQLLILDEPAAGLGENEQVSLAATLRSFAAEGLAMIVIEHNMPFLLGLADRVMALDAGRVIAMGTPGEVRRDPSVIAAYLGSTAA